MDDDILINNYGYFRKAVLNKKIDDFVKVNNLKFETGIVSVIRYLFDKYKCQRVQDLIQQFHQEFDGKNTDVAIETYDIEKNLFNNITRKITDEELRKTCQNKSIQKLIESKLEIESIESKIIETKNEITSIDTFCYNKVKELI
jgi:hypothetical protein